MGKNKSGSEEIRADFLVIGSGIAGLTYALKAADLGSVAVITKKQDSESNTNYAQGGIACVASADDSFDSHIQDTLKAGEGLCHPQIVSNVVRAGPRLIQELEQMGVCFNKDKTGNYHLTREGGHSRSRVVHVADATGRTVEKVLLERISQKPSIKIFENHLAIDLITEHHLSGDRKKPGQGVTCWGAYVLGSDSPRVKKFLSAVTMLACGGGSQIYQHSTNPEIATGDGVAMGYRAGAEVANLEFFQFHPTSLYHPQGKNFLISETVRGEGGKLKLKNGQRFMDGYHPQAELAPRDLVARAIDTELKKSGDVCVYLDITHLDKKYLTERFPNIYHTCLKLGIDISEDLIPVVPAAHYMCGGIRTDEFGRTSIRDLYACGETACTGMHGANRLASNSLLEGLAFADFAACDAQKNVEQIRNKYIPEIPDWSEKGVFDQNEWVVISHDLEEIQKLMWDYVGIVRSDRRLERAQKRLSILRAEIDLFYRQNPVSYNPIELRNLSTLADLVVRSAILRKESRGLHFNQDHPRRDDENYLQDTILLNRRV
ncbi:MAG: L-aspartate oxidase [candidate division Zixibacteria bacterium]|nr:L-aspartate oxidase [candidate division Zixibacteria bacterium]